MIKTILLIDDDHTINEYHKIIIKNENICENLVIHRYGTAHK